MVGERLSHARITTRGLPGDRGWAVRDREAGEIRGGKKLPALMQCSASYASEAGEGPPPPPLITLPSGRSYRSDDPCAASELSQLLGRQVELCSLGEGREREHFRLVHPAQQDEVRRQLGVGAGEPDPDLSELPLSMLLKLSVFATPPGTYFDAYPLHLLTTASLEALREVAPEGSFDVRRFRPNVLIETVPAARGLVEFGWCPGTLHLGEAIVSCEARTVRCSMPARPQAGLPKDATVLRAVRDHADRHLGIYATVVRAGVVREGDAVTLHFSRWHPVQEAYSRFRKSVKRKVLAGWSAAAGFGRTPEPPTGSAS